MDDIDYMLRFMPADWARRWCEGGICACLGCANNSGGLAQKGYSKKMWEEAIKRLDAAQHSSEEK